MADDTWFVTQSAISSRFLLLFFQAVLNEVMDDYDSSSFIQESEFQSTWGDVLFGKVFGGFAKWDAVYFLKIANEGYKYEQFMAFFPLYPWTLRTLAWMFEPVAKFLISKRNALLLLGWISNTVWFTLGAVALYKLTLRLFGRRKVALVSALLFCINPASVFMSSLYTESLFSFLQFTALYYLENEILISAVLLFSLGSATRSNGIISCGFVAHCIAKKILSCTSLPQQVSYEFIVGKFFSVLIAFLKMLLFNGIVVAPFILFQLYGYKLYCSDTSLAKLAWCNKWLPFPYSHIQSTYWDVGFLRYFEVKQIPNFLLASPMIVLCLCAILTYCCDQRNHNSIKTLALLAGKHKQDDFASRRSIHQSEKRDTDFYHSPSVLVYVVHLAFMTFFGFTSMHVQVITRFIASASPLIYWYSAHVIIRETAESSYRNLKRKWKSRLILGYFLLYFFIGTALHCNFYPWT